MPAFVTGPEESKEGIETENAYEQEHGAGLFAALTFSTREKNTTDP